MPNWRRENEPAPIDEAWVLLPPSLYEEGGSLSIGYCPVWCLGERLCPPLWNICSIARMWQTALGRAIRTADVEHKCLFGTALFLTKDGVRIRTMCPAASENRS
jgi:hypothetical protein